MSAGTTTSNETSRLSRSAPRWLNTALVVGIGYALAVLTVKMLPATEQAFVPVATANASNAPQRVVIDKLAMSRDIASAHLFGDVTKVPVDKPAEKKPIVKTKLNLKLTGVAAYEPQEKAIAIINTGGSEEKAFLVGETVIGQTKLKAVYPDRVILDNRGREEVLELPENVTPIAVRPTAQTRQASSQAAGANTAGPVDNLPSTPGALRDTLAKNPSLLGRVVAAEPYQENGKLRGYRITPKQNPEILESQGILAGDIITRVNNIELNSQKQGVRALRNAVKAENLEVTILRDGVEIPLSISLAQ